MRDFAFVHLANRAEIDEIRHLGDVRRKIVLSGADVVNVTRVELKENNVDPASVSVIKDGIGLPMSRTFPPPIATYYFSDNSSVNGYDEIILPSAAINELKVLFSTFEEFKLATFELRGRGFRFVTEVKVGDILVKDISVINDNRVIFKISKDLENSVVLENTRALIPVDFSALTSDIIFDLSTRARSASGPRLVLQRFLTILHAPDGANLMEMLPKGLQSGPGLRNIILSRLSAAVSITRARMRRTTPLEAPPNEVLKDAFVEGVTSNVDGSVEATIKIVTMDGNSVRSPITLGV